MMDLYTFHNMDQQKGAHMHPKTITCLAKVMVRIGVRIAATDGITIAVVEMLLAVNSLLLIF
jgi:hypothetical protein